MRRRRDFLAVAAGAVAASTVPPMAARADEGARFAPPSTHADGELLALCARLAEMQAEWQRLYDRTPDDGPETAADHVWQDYSDTVWPGGDLPGQLCMLQATTPAGLQAKGAAILALDDVAAYCDDRPDYAQLADSLVQDVAAGAWRTDRLADGAT
jgi:hypothetical protein